MEGCSCDPCFCQLKNTSRTKQATAAAHKCIGPSFMNSPVMGRICLQSSSPSICDALVDCLSGDQDPDYFSQRKGRRVELEQKRAETWTDSGTSEHQFILPTQQHMPTIFDPLEIIATTVGLVSIICLIFLVHTVWKLFLSVVKYIK